MLSDEWNQVSVSADDLVATDVVRAQKQREVAFLCGVLTNVAQEERGFHGGAIEWLEVVESVLSAMTVGDARVDRVENLRTRAGCVQG